MSTRLAAALATLATIAAALLMAGPAAAVLSDGGYGGVTPLSPTDAEALATDPAAETGGMTPTTLVDGSVVLAAGLLPGADTFVDPSLSPEEAVGIAPASGGLSPDNLRGCWANAVWHRWGTWPYQQKITDTTYWCAVYGGHITYETSTTTGSGTLCTPSLPTSQLIAGGVGKLFTFFTVRASSFFSCATVIPWITIHETHHEDVRRDDRGTTTVVRTG